MVAGFALWFAHRADRRQELAAQRDADRFKRELSAAERDRRRFAREHEQAEAIKRADLTIIPAGGGGPEAERRQFLFYVQNGGPAVAKAICLWLVDENGGTVSSVECRVSSVECRVSSVDEYPLLTAGEKTETARSITTYTVVEPPLTLRVGWLDDAGPHERDDIQVS